MKVTGVRRSCYERWRLRGNSSSELSAAALVQENPTSRTEHGVIDLAASIGLVDNVIGVKKKHDNVPTSK